MVHVSSLIKKYLDMKASKQEVEKLPEDKKDDTVTV